MKTIIVIGDWLVDEHWLTGIHRSATSSRVGNSHFRGLQNSNCAIQSFCGAGQTASALLRSSDINSKNPFKIFGIGVWDKSDSDYLCSMLNQKDENLLTPHRIIYNDHHDPNPNVNLFNIADRIVGKDKDIRIGTTKVIRIYQNTGKKIELLQRIDWELELPSEYSKGWISNNEEGNKILADIRDKLDIFSNEIEAIVIKDLCKGVVSSALVRFFAEKYPNVPWFVSTKAWKMNLNPSKSQENEAKWEPDWLDELKKVNLRLFLIPQIPAKLLVDQGIIGHWLTKHGSLSPEAMKILEDFFTIFADKKKFALMVLSGNSVISLIKEDKIKCYIKIADKNHKISFGLPMASLFLASAVNKMLLDDSIKIGEVIEASISFTNSWAEYESKRIICYEYWKPTKVPTVTHVDVKNYPKMEFIDWEQESKNWVQAHNDLGIIGENSSHPRFELWRGMSDIDGYICLSKRKKRLINVLKKELREYKNYKNKKSKAFLIQAAPGSGKSHLIKCLAQSLDFELLSFNISQMLDKKDILDCFETIIATKFNKKTDHPFIVFFDEINAQINKEYVYEMFLAPLEDGVFVRNGKTYPINPFVWMFVGTENSTAMKTKEPKADDFISRLSLPPQVFISDNTEPEQRSIYFTELVYIGVALLKSSYPDIRWISKKVLSTFNNLPASGVRDIKHFVKAFQNIQYGKVISKNIPTDWISVFASEFNFGNYERQEEGPLIEIS